MEGCLRKNGMRGKNVMRKRINFVFTCLCCAALAGVFVSCLLEGDVEVWRRRAAEANGICTVTFNTNGGGDVPEQTVKRGGRVSEPQGVVRSGYILEGWYTDNDTFENRWNFSVNTISGNIILHANWVDSTTVWTVKFDTNGGSPVGDVYVLRNTSVSRPTPDPTRAGYTFDNWYSNPELTSIYNFSSIVIRDITLYAKWMPNSAGITLDVAQITDGAPLIADITISRSNNGYPVTYTVSVNADDFDVGSIAWEVAGVGVYIGQTVSGSGPSFILNAADVKYNSLGIHVLLLTVTQNGTRYQRAVPFTVVR